MRGLEIHEAVVGYVNLSVVGFTARGEHDLYVGVCVLRLVASSADLEAYFRTFEDEGAIYGIFAAQVVEGKVSITVTVEFPHEVSAAEVV